MPQNHCLIELTNQFCYRARVCVVALVWITATGVSCKHKVSAIGGLISGQRAAAYCKWMKKCTGLELKHVVMLAFTLPCVCQCSFILISVYFSDSGTLPFCHAYKLCASQSLKAACQVVLHGAQGWMKPQCFTFMISCLPLELHFCYRKRIKWLCTNERVVYSDKLIQHYQLSSFLQCYRSFFFSFLS